MVDVVLAVILDFMIGDPLWFPHPIRYIGKLIKALENSFRKHCKTKASLKVAGGFIVIIVCTVCFSLPFFILKVTEGIIWLHHIINIIIIWTTIAARCLHVEGKKVYDSLQKKDIEDARRKLSYIVGRDTKELNEKEIIRADVETIAENTSDGIIAPLLFAFIFGAPLAMLYKGINTMDSMLGYKNEKYGQIGFFPAKIDDIFNYFPARITGILMCITAPLIGGNIMQSFKIMMRDRRKHKSPNCGYPEAAAAGAMQIQIGGTHTYFGEIVEKPTIGDHCKEPNIEHINDSIKLMYGTEILLLAMVIVFNIIKNEVFKS